LVTEPPGSLAVALIVRLVPALTTVPLAGLVMLTVGALLTVTEIAAEVVLAPLLSVVLLVIE
jgi:hypothetical protein